MKNEEFKRPYKPELKVDNKPLVDETARAQERLKSLLHMEYSVEVQEEINRLSRQSHKFKHFGPEDIQSAKDYIADLRMKNGYRWDFPEKNG